MINTDLLKNIITNKSNNVYDMSIEKPVMLVFLRHFGCIFCQEAMMDLAKRKQELSDQGINLVFVHMSDKITAQHYFDKYNLSEFEHISDPQCRFYGQFGLTKGSFSQLFGLRVWTRGFQAIQEGSKLSLKQIGDGFQMPGIFMIDQGQIMNSYIHQSSADKPDYISLSSCCAA